MCMKCRIMYIKAHKDSQIKNTIHGKDDLDVVSTKTVKAGVSGYPFNIHLSVLIIISSANFPETILRPLILTF